MPAKELNKTCGICGDKAIGYYNFNAITCDSCKAFFRRNASKIDQFKCYFDGKCRISATTRKVCKKCRLNKCFEIGMKKEWILTEEEKKWRNRKIEINRKKRGVRARSLSSHSSDDCPHSPSSSVSSSVADQNSAINHEIPEIKIKTEMVEMDVTSDTESKQFLIAPIGRPFNDYRNNFTEIEGIKLSELLSAVTIMKYVPDNKISTKMIIQDPVIERACMAWAQKCQNEIERIVTMSKHLTGFRNMCQNDQIAIIKYGSVEIYIMRLIFQFDFNNQFFTLANDNNCVILKLDLLRRFRRNLFDAYDIFLRKIGSEWDSDPIIIDLLTAIVLYNPERPDLIHRADVQFQQNIYMYLLQRYLLLKYRSEYESKLKFRRLMDVLIDLNNVTKQHRLNYSKKDPDKVLPLLREIFDVRKSDQEYYIEDNYSTLRAITIDEPR